jgi:[ribosomal protein S5]-alanine N-acetyltransferase
MTIPWGSCGDRLAARGTEDPESPPSVRYGAMPQGANRHPGERRTIGRRVYLDRPTAAGRHEFLDRVRASRALHRSWVAPPASNRDYDAYVRRNRADDFEAFVSRRRDDDALVGVTNLSQIFRGSFQNACLGFYAFAPFAGRGYMTEAVDLVLRHAFRAMQLHRVEANVQLENRRSRALVEQLGFRLEGVSPRYLKVAGRWRDHERWAIRAEEWRPVSLRRP